MVEDSVALARRLVRALDRAALATTLDGWPYASLVLVATAPDGSPLLLLSDLAEHSKNLKRDRHVSLLFDGTSGLVEPLTGPRLTLLGEAAETQDAGDRERYVARHPGAAAYAGFRDFHLYRVKVARGHLVAGFGRIEWISAEKLIQPPPAALVAAEASILEHMNEDHRETLDVYANALLNKPGQGWRMTGVDAEGGDLRRGGEVARLDFAAPVSDAEGVRAELVRLAKLARRGI